MMVGSPDRGNPLSHHRAQGSLSEPADHPSVITVGALTISTTRTEATYSSRGPTTDGRFKPNLLSPTGAGNSSPSASFGGTSAAAPHVAGALALLQEAFPTADSDRLAALLPTGAQDARLVGDLDVVLAVVEYDGPDRYPTRFAHLLVDYRPVRIIFAFQDGVWRSYSPRVPAWVNSLSTIDDGQEIYVFFDPFVQ